VAVLRLLRFAARSPVWQHWLSGEISWCTWCIARARTTPPMRRAGASPRRVARHLRLCHPVGPQAMIISSRVFGQETPAAGSGTQRLTGTNCFSISYGPLNRPPLITTARMPFALGNDWAAVAGARVWSRPPCAARSCSTMCFLWRSQLFHLTDTIRLPFLHVFQRTLVISRRLRFHGRPQSTLLIFGAASTVPRFPPDVDAAHLLVALRAAAGQQQCTHGSRRAHRADAVAGALKAVFVSRVSRDPRGLSRPFSRLAHVSSLRHHRPRACGAGRLFLAGWAVDCWSAPTLSSGYLRFLLLRHGRASAKLGRGLGIFAARLAPPRVYLAVLAAGLWTLPPRIAVLAAPRLHTRRGQFLDAPALSRRTAQQRNTGG